MKMKKKKKKMKDKVLDDDRNSREAAKAKRPELDILDQSWHDSRYHEAIKKGVSHSAAWAQEKKRRKAALNRKAGQKERREEFKKADLAWHEEFDDANRPVQEGDNEDDVAEGIETEAVDTLGGDKVRIHSGKAKAVTASTIKPEEKDKLFKSERKYRKLTQDEVEKFKTETKEDELAVMKRKRVNIYAQRVRKMTKDKKDKRRDRVRAARKRRREEETEAFYLNHPKDARRCEKFIKSACHKGKGRSMIHSEVDPEKHHIEKDMSRVKLTPNPEFRGELNSFGGGEACTDDWTHIVANFDTGAAVTAIPSVLKEKLGLQPSETSTRSYKTASGELLADEGGTVLNGYDNDGQGRSVTGRLVNVHRMLVSGSAVGKKNCVMLDGASGTIIPNDGPIADGVRRSLQQLINRRPKDARRLTSMYQQGGDNCKTTNAEDLGAVDGAESGFPRQAPKP